MENIIVSSLKLGLLGFFVFLVGIVIDWTFKLLGFYKRDWILNGIFSFIVTILGLAFFITLNLSKNSYKALRGNFIFWMYFVFGIAVFCGLLVLIRSIFRRKKIVFIYPGLKSVSEEDRKKITKHTEDLRKKKCEICFFVKESWINKNFYFGMLKHSADKIIFADEIHIWYTDDYDEIWFVLGVYFSYHSLFGNKKVVIINDGYSLLYGGNNPMRKIIFELEQTF